MARFRHLVFSCLLLTSLDMPGLVLSCLTEMQVEKGPGRIDNPKERSRQAVPGLIRQFPEHQHFLAADSQN